MRLQDLITDRKVYENVEHHRDDECYGRVTLDFAVDTVLRVCDLMILVKRPRKQERESADPGDPKYGESITNEPFLDENGMDTFEKEI